MNGKTILLIITLTLALNACAAEPETIIETVIHEATVEVLQTVEVTRQVEVPVEVTRQVEVTKEITVEITKIVEVIVTATPEPTPEPTQEPTPTNTQVAVEAPQPAAETLPPAAPNVASGLLQASRAMREHILSFRDNGLGSGDCYIIVEKQDNFLAAPSFDVSGTSLEVQSAYGHYLAALDLAKDAALGIGQGCREAITNNEGFSITGLNYNVMRGKLDRALEQLAPAIDILESLPDE